MKNVRVEINLAKRTSFIVVAECIILLSTASALGGLVTDKTNASCGLPSVGYYLAVYARVADDQTIAVIGASNLPSGSIVLINISNFIGEGSHSLNGDDIATVGDDGTFRVAVTALKGAKFKTNQICYLVFQPHYPKQPASVLQIVGRDGEHLGAEGKNPQIQDNGRGKLLFTTVVVGD